MSQKWESWVTNHSIKHHAQVSHLNLLQHTILVRRHALPIWWVTCIVDSLVGGSDLHECMYLATFLFCQLHLQQQPAQLAFELHIVSAYLSASPLILETKDGVAVHYGQQNKRLAKYAYVVTNSETKRGPWWILEQTMSPRIQESNYIKERSELTYKPMPAAFYKCGPLRFNVLRNL